MEKSKAVQIGQVNAGVTNNRHTNPRLMFEYKLTIEKLDNGFLKATRVWQGASSKEIAIEEVLWCCKNGLQFASMNHPDLNERGCLDVKNGHGTAKLSSYKTKYKEKEKNLNFVTSPCTLLSVPFEIAKHWDALMNGRKIELDYTVLKVQAHTGITLQKRNFKDKIVISVTPKKWFWKMLFGSTDFHFNSRTHCLEKIDGLLEPRDKNLKGKYVEYLGLATFDTAMDLSIIREHANV